MTFPFIIMSKCLYLCIVLAIIIPRSYSESTTYSFLRNKEEHPGNASVNISSIIREFSYIEELYALYTNHLEYEHEFEKTIQEVIFRINNVSKNLKSKYSLDLESLKDGKYKNYIKLLAESLKSRKASDNYVYLSNMKLHSFVNYPYTSHEKQNLDKNAVYNVIDSIFPNLKYEITNKQKTRKYQNILENQFTDLEDQINFLTRQLKITKLLYRNACNENIKKVELINNLEFVNVELREKLTDSEIYTFELINKLKYLESEIKLLTRKLLGASRIINELTREKEINITREIEQGEKNGFVVDFITKQKAYTSAKNHSITNLGGGGVSL